MSYSFVDLFCGAGLFSYGFKSAGFEPVAAYDIDAKAIASYRRNVAEVAKVADIAKAENLSGVDVLIAGPPCQGFSTLGRRDPKDERNQLSLAVCRWAEATKARVVVIENVPRFLDTRVWSTIRRRLSALGYSVEKFELEAAEFGAPQMRRRAFTVASKVGAVGAPSPLRRNSFKSVRDSILESPPRAGDPMHIWPEPGELALERFRAIPRCGDKRDLIDRRPDLCPPSWSQLRNEATDVWGRVDPDMPANTLRCAFQNPSKGRYIHPFENRVLSLREGARLQGVPDSWVFSGERYPIARQIGNGVPIQLGRAVARKVAAALEARDNHRRTRRAA